MSEYFPPTAVSPSGPFPEGTDFFEDDASDLYVRLPDLSLYEVNGDRLEPVKKSTYQLHIDHFVNFRGGLREETYYKRLRERED